MLALVVLALIVFGVASIVFRDPVRALVAAIVAAAVAWVLRGVQW